MKLQGGEYLNTKYIPSVDHKPHKDLQSNVTQFLLANDFITYDDTYATNATELIRQILSYRFSPTALKLRTKADLFAIHKTIKSEFFIEFKTDTKYKNLAIELFPLLCHISDSGFGIKCLYIFQVSGICGGFWVYSLPKIRQIFFSSRIEYANINPILRKLTCVLLPNIPTSERSTQGSGDPFCIIDEAEIKKCISWDRLILDTIKIVDKQPDKIWNPEGDLWD